MSSVVTQRKTKGVKPPRPVKSRPRPAQDLVLMVILDFPLPLKKKLAKQAKQADTNMTNLVVTALAQEFGVKFVPSSRKWASPPGESCRLSLAMPYKLRTKIANIARTNHSTMREVVIDTLSKRFK